MFHIVPDEVKRHDLSEAVHPSTNFKGWYVKETGEHYKLCSYLADQLTDALIFDTGTAQGASAVAFAAHAWERNNFIITADVVDRRSYSSFHPEGKYFSYKGGNRSAELPIDFIQISCNSRTVEYLLPQCSLIMLDISHTGHDEREFYETCKRVGFTGLMIVDDIGKPLSGRRPSALRDFWDLIELPKHELTDFCHWNGTGIVDFGCGVDLIETPLDC
jgi:hypothetical protein